MRIISVVTEPHEIIEHEGETYKRYNSDYWEKEVSDNHYYEFFNPELEEIYQKNKKYDKMGDQTVSNTLEKLLNELDYINRQLDVLNNFDQWNGLRLVVNASDIEIPIRKSDLHPNYLEGRKTQLHARKDRIEKTIERIEEIVNGII